MIQLRSWNQAKAVSVVPSETRQGFTGVSSHVSIVYTKLSSVNQLQEYIL